VQEKEQVLHEVHGAAEAIEDEQPDFTSGTPASVSSTQKKDKIQGKSRLQSSATV
jgi:hypothetical protein